MKPTDRPWQWKASGNWTVHIVDNNGNIVATCRTSEGEHWATTQHKAALIVKAVNSHDALVEALQNIVDNYTLNYQQAGITIERMEQARAALKLAGAK